MLKILGESARHCDGLTRRSFLQVGALGLGGLALPDLLRLRSQARGAGADHFRDRSGVVAWRTLYWPMIYGEVSPSFVDKLVLAMP